MQYRVGIIGATGYVGQRLVTLLAEHPWFKIVGLAASSRSAGQRYGALMASRWKLPEALPESVQDLKVEDAASWAQQGRPGIDLVFCAVNLEKNALKAFEEDLARQEWVVVSNNSAHRMTEDVPMIIPEVNAHHLELIAQQRQRLKTQRGFIVCKPNCSIQAYVSALTPLKAFEPEAVIVTTYQAVSGAGRRLQDWPEIQENVIPYISNEETKSEQEPLKIWGTLDETGLKFAQNPVISAQCYRVAVQEGHLAAVSVKFKHKPSIDEIHKAWSKANETLGNLKLPSSPKQWLTYLEEVDRPQPKQDASLYGGMGITIGRLRTDPVMDYKFTCLAHNTLRGAAGGAVLTAELLAQRGYLNQD